MSLAAGAAALPPNQSELGPETEANPDWFGRSRPRPRGGGRRATLSVMLFEPERRAGADYFGSRGAMIR